MKPTTITHVSVDGVMQGLGGSNEDRRRGFERGGWALPLFGGEAEAFLVAAVQRADAFLFGRRTYEIFAGYWGVMPDPDSNPVAVLDRERVVPGRIGLPCRRSGTSRRPVRSRCASASSKPKSAPCRTVSEILRRQAFTR
jgi:hypothetical protein